MNTQKYETYKSINESLSKALKYGFYYEAIFLEYAIVEDRLASVLKYAGIGLRKNLFRSAGFG